MLVVFVTTTTHSAQRTAHNGNTNTHNLNRSIPASVDASNDNDKNTVIIIFYLLSNLIPINMQA